MLIKFMLVIVLLALPLAQATLPEVEVSPEAISILAGALLSLLFSFVPGFATWYQRLGEDKPDDNGTMKRLVMLGLIFVTVLGIYLLGRFGVIHIAGDIGLSQIIYYFILALMGNQGTFQITPKVGLNASRAGEK